MMPRVSEPTTSDTYAPSCGSVFARSTSLVVYTESSPTSCIVDASGGFFGVKPHDNVIRETDLETC
jgi:hypothetical protein